MNVPHEANPATASSPAPASMSTPARPDLRGMSLTAMETMLEAAGFERYRARQLYQWVFRRLAPSLDAMHNLPKALRAWLAEHASLDGGLRLERADGQPGQTRKALFRLADGRAIESVLMIEADADEDAEPGSEPDSTPDSESGSAPDGNPSPSRPSLCLSSQVGCPLDCQFCRTGWGGYQRNLTVAEIVGQAIEIQRQWLGPDERVRHVVFMGMGEPLLNLEAVVPAIRLLTDPDGLGVGRRRVTVSTAGVVPGLSRLGTEGLGVGLAVSLNATTDDLRDKLMPINRKWNLAVLTDALRRYPLEPRRRITIEYVLLRGLNDSPDDARRLVRLLHGIRCKVNAIMYNETPELPYRQSDAAALGRFMDVLRAARLTVSARWSKGSEIEAACGQLAAHRKEAGPAPSVPNPPGATQHSEENWVDS
jgi:23S rRNA (adenine2503-C2)-methyltransferase